MEEAGDTRSLREGSIHNDMDVDSIKSHFNVELSGKNDVTYPFLGIISKMAKGSHPWQK